MSASLHHECIRVPVTALAAVGPFVLAADGPLLHVYSQQDSNQFRFLGSRRIFKEHAIHGVASQQNASGIILAIWGGPLVRFLRLQNPPCETAVEAAIVGNAQLSAAARAADWILDLSFGPDTPGNGSTDTVAVCAVITAHNSLAHISLERTRDGLVPHITELTLSSRTILYSAHLLWDSADHVLVAAGTAFGEIMYWSWTRNAEGNANARIHKVFLGHEGSIFGVQISEEMDIGSGKRRRFLASCSDDRTLRIWDVSGISTSLSADVNGGSGFSDSERTRHTGFSNAELESDASGSPCLAIGWGHLSRVWAVQFLDRKDPSPTITLVSSGEDATSRTWQFTVAGEDSAANSAAAPLKLKQVGTAGYHSGKNIWSTAVLCSLSGQQQIVTGGADSKVCAYKLSPSVFGEEKHPSTSEYSLQEISQACPAATGENEARAKAKGSRPKDFLRSYAFIDDSSFILSTNSGNVFLQSTGAPHEACGTTAISESKLIAQLEDIGRYSICAGEPTLGVGFVAGSNGNIYMYRKGFALTKVHTATGKVGTMFIGRRASDPSSEEIFLLVTCMGRSVAELVYIGSLLEGRQVAPEKIVNVNLPESDTVTSMAYVSTGTSQDECLIVGFRSGAIVGYALGADSMSGSSSLSPNQIFNRKVHGKEAVTSLLWYPSASKPSNGHLVSGGRDGCCAVHHVDIFANNISLINHLPLAIGPNIEGLYDHHGKLMMYGFSSSKFILYNVTEEEETMSVDTGGSRRSWAFRPDLSQAGGGTLVWTQATSMHIHSQKGPNHEVVRAGGHGREIKTVAVANGVGGDASRILIATGAEDTDIKIFEYADGDLVCRRTLRKHVTGIQQLQWSDDGEYLFSSGGCEEFFVWRVRTLPPFIGIGVLCESVCAPESEHSDLRLMAFDTRREGNNFTIAMVFSDSSIRVYNYTPAGDSDARWRMLASGIYFTSCLTQCVLLSPSTILTAGTDGHAVLWPFDTSAAAAEKESLVWRDPARVHQNTSKTVSTLNLSSHTTLVVSGGDDGTLSFLLVSPSSETKAKMSYRSPPTILVRAHTSAITACAIVAAGERKYVLTSGNDEWIRLWEVEVGLGNDDRSSSVNVKRVSKLKTHVADVSGMAILEQGDGSAKVVVCGVGMEVLRLSWDC